MTLYCNISSEICVLAFGYDALPFAIYNPSKSGMGDRVMDGAGAVIVHKHYMLDQCSTYVSETAFLAPLIQPGLIFFRVYFGSISL